MLFKSISKNLLVLKREIERAALSQELSSTSWFSSYEIKEKLRPYKAENIPG